MDVRIVDVPLSDPRLLAQTPRMPESWEKEKRERDLLGSGMNSNDTLRVLRDLVKRRMSGDERGKNYVILICYTTV